MSKRTAEILEPLREAVRAVGVSEVARRSFGNVNYRKHLYNVFSEYGNPTLETVVKLMDAVGWAELTIDGEEE